MNNQHQTSQEARRRLRRQHGYSLIELSIGLTIVTMLVIYFMQFLRQQSEESAAAATANQMLIYKTALEQYNAVNSAALITSGAGALIAQPICAAPNARTGANIAAPLAPTLTDLMTGGCIGQPTLPALTPTRQSIATAIQLQNCPGAACQIFGIAYTTTPLTMGGTQPRYDLVSTFLQVAKGTGGASFYGSEGTIKSVSFSMPNPVTLTDGSAAGGVIAVGTVPQVGVFNLTVNGSLILANAATEGGACSTLGAIVRNASNALILICNGTTWKSSTGSPSNIVANAACPIDAQQGIDGTAVSYICRGGTWKRLQDMLPTAVEMARYLVQDGSVVAQPTCATGGTPAYDLIPISVSTDLTGTPPYEGAQYGATLSGTNWVVSMLLVTATNASESGGTYLTGRLKALCLY